MEVVKQNTSHEAVKKKSWKRRKEIGHTDIHHWVSIIVLTVISIPMIYIYAYVFLVAFAGHMDGFIPTRFTLENFSFMWSEFNLGSFRSSSIWPIFGNTLIFAVSSAVLEVGLSLMAGYALSRGRFPGKSALLQSTILTHAFPAVTGLIASFYILKAVGLLNTLTGVILLKGIGGVGMSTWIIKGFFDEVPKELDWAAKVDGCGQIKSYVKVFLPYIWPGVVAISLFAFLGGWGEFVLLSVFIFDNQLLTLPIIMQSFLRETNTETYGFMMAVAAIYMLPGLLLYFLSQKQLDKIKI